MNATTMLPALTFDSCRSREDAERRIEAWVGLCFDYHRLFRLTQLLTAAALNGQSDTDERLDELTTLNSGLMSDALVALLALCEMLENGNDAGH